MRQLIPITRTYAGSSCGKLRRAWRPASQLLSLLFAPPHSAQPSRAHSSWESSSQLPWLPRAPLLGDRGVAVRRRSTIGRAPTRAGRRWHRVRPPPSADHRDRRADVPRRRIRHPPGRAAVAATFRVWSVQGRRRRTPPRTSGAEPDQGVLQLPCHPAVPLAQAVRDAGDHARHRRAEVRKDRPFHRARAAAFVRHRDRKVAGRHPPE